MTTSSLVGSTFFGIDISRLGPQLMSIRRRLSKRLLLLEFSSSGLRYAEAVPSMDGIHFNHISRVPLPEEALERGVPSDPAMMASLIRALCQEKAIPAHRAAVVLSPDVAYQRIVELPPSLTAEEARNYLCDSANCAALPFPLEQTDFDVYPLPYQQSSSLQPYLLIAVPQVLIDRVISLLDTAGFELHALELGPFSLLRFVADELISLSASDLHLVLELLPDCSQLCAVSSCGPLRFERLSAIRDFPDPELDEAQRTEALEAGLSAEEMTLQDERYLPISELDLRAVLRDVKAVISELKDEVDSRVVRGLSLSGANSAHPLIKDFFQEALGCDVRVIKPVLMPRVSSFSTDDLLVQAGLARLIGLGLGFLPREQLLSCHVPEISSPSIVAPLLSPAAEGCIDSEVQSSISVINPLDVEVTNPAPVGLVNLDSDDSLNNEAAKVEEVRVDEERVSSEGEEEWPSMGLDFEKTEDLEKVEEVRVDEERVSGEGEEEWPSMGLDFEKTEDLEKVEEVRVDEERVSSEGEEEWPSMGLDFEKTEASEKVEEVRVDEERVSGEGEEEWPSMGLDFEKTEASEKVEEVRVDEERVSSEGEEEWPSINAIPGLDASVSTSSPRKNQSISQSESAVDSSSTLGELRFKDE